MEMDLDVQLRDLGEPLVAAWRDAFEAVSSVKITCGDIFSDKEGPISAGAPIDVLADAIVSPANSFGFMDGGIDAVYTYQFGPKLQERVQAIRADQHSGELPVGQAIIVPTGNREIPWCISAPTMRTPGDVAETVNAYLAFRAALLAVLRHNQRGAPPIRSILCPGLGTAVGRMPVERCARQMRAAWDRVLGGKPFTPATIRAASMDEEALLR